MNLSPRTGWRFQGGEWNDYRARSLIWNDSNDVHATRVYDEPFISIFSWTRSFLGSPCKVFACEDWKKVEQELNNPSTPRCRCELPDICLLRWLQAVMIQRQSASRTRAFSRCRIRGPGITATISGVKSRSASSFAVGSGVSSAGVNDLLINAHHFAMIVWAGTPFLQSCSILISARQRFFPHHSGHQATGA